MLKTILRTFIIVLGISMLTACNDHRKVSFSSPDTRQKLRAENPWPDNSFIVLAYHDVEDDSADQRFMSVRTSALRDQFAWLRENGYQPISVEQIRAAHRGEITLPRKAVLLSFDDGYQSFYTRVFPLLEAYQWPALWAPVGSWVDTPANKKVKFGDEYIDREKIATWQQIAELARSPLVEIGAHTWNSHYGVQANPSGGKLPAIANRSYNPGTSTYETEQQYRRRVSADGQNITVHLKKHTGKQPKSWVWPYGAENGVAIQELKKLGYDTFFTLEDGLATADNLDAIPRLLINNNPSLIEFAQMVASVQEQSAMRSISVSLDSVYDTDKNRQEKNIDILIQQIKDMAVSTVFLQASVTPPANGLTREVYFPNRWLPVREDLFNRIAWQLRTRAGVAVYASMPLVNWDFSPAGMGKPSQVIDAVMWQKIHDMYEDLAAHSVFDGIIFGDEKASRDRVFANNSTSTALTLSLANTVKSVRGPSIKTAGQLVAVPELQPQADDIFYRRLHESLRLYDWTIIVANPYQAKQDKKSATKWLQQLAGYITRLTAANDKTSVQLETQYIHGDTTHSADVKDIANWMELLQLNGVRNYGYKPNDFLTNKEHVHVIRPEFSTNWYPENE